MKKPEFRTVATAAAITVGAALLGMLVYDIVTIHKLTKEKEEELALEEEILAKIAAEEALDEE